ncbi:MAG: hypothetical protein IH965_02165 [Gemmatimonadetes bacterium]|nr:hypothetical protein [Gemmatimonadota bacterium]
MTRHCTTEELLAARNDEASPAVAEHIAACAECQRELDAIRQRVAALRALPTRRPPRDRWPIVKAQAQAERRKARLARLGWTSLAVAAGLVLAVGVRSANLTTGQPGDDRPGARVVLDQSSGFGAARPQLANLMEQSQRLEAALRYYGPEGRVLSGRAASIIAQLEDRIAAVDAGIVQVGAGRGTSVQLMNLWWDRVQLMDALVSTHVTRATYIGF